MNFCRLNKSLFLLLISSSPRVPLLCKFTPQRASISVILFKIPSSLGLILSSVRSWTRRPSFQDVCVGCEEFWGRKKGPLHADSSVWPAFNVPSATAIRWSPTAEAAAFVEILHLLIEGEGGVFLLKHARPLQAADPGFLPAPAIQMMEAPPCKPFDLCCFIHHFRAVMSTVQHLDVDTLSGSEPNRILHL